VFGIPPLRTEPNERDLEVALDYRFKLNGKEISIRKHLLALQPASSSSECCVKGDELPRGVEGEFDLIEQLIGGGFIAGEVDELGHVMKCDLSSARHYVQLLIQMLDQPADLRRQQR